MMIIPEYIVFFFSFWPFKQIFCLSVYIKYLNIGQKCIIQVIMVKSDMHNIQKINFVHVAVHLKNV